MQDIDELLTEFRGLDGEETLKLIVEKLATMQKEQTMLQSKLSRLEHVFHKSELIVSIPAFDIVTTSKLPHLIIEANDPIAFDQNLYEVEEYNDKAYRFMGPEKLTSFSLPIERSTEKDVTITLFSEVTDGIFGSLKLYLDGAAIEHQLDANGSSAVIRFKLPSVNSNHETLLTIYSPVVFRPADIIEGSEDFRYISASLISIEVM